MFLYDNNIISENSLRVETEPEVDFYSEALSYNKELLSNSMRATKEMLDVIAEYGDSEKVVQESFSDFKDKIVKFLKEFKARIIVLFRRWLDWIAKKLNMKGRYGDEAVKTLLADQNKRNMLKNFRYTLNEEVDFGYKYFNELTTANYANGAHDIAIGIFGKRINDLKDQDKASYEIKKMKDDFVAQTTDILNGSKTRELTIDDIETLYNNKTSGQKLLNTYESKVMTAINRINDLAKRVTANKGNPEKDQHACMTLVTIASCLGDHLSAMANNYSVYIDRINTAFTNFLPAAEEYLLANG